MSLTDEDKRWITTQLEGVETVLRHDPEAWEAGFVAGEKGRTRCPYPVPSRRAWSWESGRVEGAAKREGYGYSRGALQDGKNQTR